MVHDEASGVAQAVGTKTRAFAIAGNNQEINALSDRADNFALNPSPKMKELGVLSSKQRCRSLKDLQSLPVRDLFEMAAGPLRAKDPT